MNILLVIDSISSFSPYPESFLIHIWIYKRFEGMCLWYIYDMDFEWLTMTQSLYCHWWTCLCLWHYLHFRLDGCVLSCIWLDQLSFIKLVQKLHHRWLLSMNILLVINCIFSFFHYPESFLIHIWILFQHFLLCRGS